MHESFWKALISLFVAIDVFGALPIFTSLTQQMTSDQRKKLVRKAVLAAAGVGLVFIFGGQAIFSFLGITENDFRVAGGVLLLIFAVSDLVLTQSHQGTTAPSSIGIVPVAIPLIMGPASLASLMVGSEQYGVLVMVLALLANLAVVWVALARANLIMASLGAETSEAIAKIFSLLLAAIGVMLIRQGITNMLAH